MAIKAADQISVVDVTDAYSVILTSETYTFVGGVAGAAAGASCTTQAVAWCGANQCANVTVAAADVVCPAGISASVTGSGSAAVTITFTTTATVAAACEASIPVQVDGVTVNKKFSFAVSKQGMTGATGAPGTGVKSTAITYQVGASGTVAPTGTWAAAIPAVLAGQYLWTRTVITYTDGTTATSYSVGMMGATGATGAAGKPGAAGNGVKTTVITYQAGTSGTAAPTGAWSDAIPAVSASQYLWTRTVTTYTDNTTTTAYSVGMMGATGAAGATGKPGADAITLSITSSNGTVFKNNNGSTVLTAHVYRAGAEQEITDAGVCGSLGSVKWYVGAATTAAATAKTLTVSAVSVTNALAYTCKLEG